MLAICGPEGSWPSTNSPFEGEILGLIGAANTGPLLSLFHHPKCSLGTSMDWWRADEVIE